MSDKYEDVESFQDARGVDTRVGDLVAWAVRSGNVGQLKIGRVEGIKYSGEGHYHTWWRITVRAREGRTTSTLWYRSRIVRLAELDD